MQPEDRSSQLQGTGCANGRTVGDEPSFSLEGQGVCELLRRWWPGPVRDTGIATEGRLDACHRADAVLFGSGPGSRKCITSREFLDSFSLDPTRQLIGSQCSGALILATLGLLDDMPATTHPRVRAELEALGISIIDAPFVVRGNVATAGGCLAATYLTSWVVERLAGREQRDAMLQSVAPVGEAWALVKRVEQVLAAVSN